MRDDMVLMLDSGWSLKAIAEFFGVSVDQVIVIITVKPRPGTGAKAQGTGKSEGCHGVLDGKEGKQ